MADRVLLFLLLLTVASPGRGQAPAAPEAPVTVQVFEEAVDVRVVNVEAVVTGVKGERVPGLKAADFRLLVDGVEMPISFFAEIDEKARRLAVANSAEEGPEGSAAPVTEPTWQSRNILVFLDETTMVKSRRDFVVRSLVQQLGRLGSGDQMAVVVFDGTRLAVLSDWTDDRALLSATFAAIQEQRPTLGIQGEASRRQEANNTSFVTQVMGVNESAVIRNSGELMVDTPETLPSDVLATGIVKQQIPFQGNLPANLFHPDDRAVEVGEAVASAMRGMPTAPGRKRLLLLTEGFPGSAFGRAAVYEANRMGYSLYPVDVQGLDSFKAQNDVEFDKARPSRPISTARDRNRDQTLGAMAKATGGRASLNSERLTALDDLVEDSAVYYLLGFSPAWRGNDRRHQIELTALRPGLKVRTRKGYDDLSHRTWLSLEAEAGLLFGRARSEPKLVFTIGEPAPGEKARPASLGVPVDSLAFFPGEKGFRAEAPVAVVALDDRGKKVVLPGTWLRVEVKQLPLAGTYARLDFTIPAQFRARRIVVTVHDALTGEALWAEAELEK